MPEQQYPPFSNDSGALVVPRQLNRWLDVNPQGGPLKRCETYITLPTFNVATTFTDASDIVASFNFEAPNNFSLKPFTAPTSPNYMLCISYRVGATVTRYILWDATGSKLNEGCPLYTGQPILKNFRLEVWNTSQGNVSQTLPITFYTSVKQNIDYRFGTDSALVTSDGTVTAFGVDTTTTTSVVNLIPNHATFEPQEADYPQYVVKGFIVGLNYALTSLGNALSLEGVITNNPFTATKTSYILYGDYGTENQLITAVVTGPSAAFTLPMQFPSNAASTTN